MCLWIETIAIAVFVIGNTHFTVLACLSFVLELHLLNAAADADVRIYTLVFISPERARFE